MPVEFRMESTRVCSIGNMDAGDVNMPQGLGRYMPEDASAPVVPSTTLDENGKPTDWSIFNPKFEWYLKNHRGGHAQLSINLYAECNLFIHHKV
ncbi:hypothetical protein B7993_06325 [Fibrobacter sp. UWH3]|nr:hypothetical protein B7993_06325 [Fibrobacter sp. UWH3]